MRAAPIIALLIIVTASAFGSDILSWPKSDLYSGDSDAQFRAGYVAGRAAALQDLRRNFLAVERYGRELVYASDEDRILLRRFGIHVKHVAGCMVMPRVAGHAKGYNDVSEPEIRRRFGNALERASREAEVRWEQTRPKT
jgi:hypothetical protein